MSDPISSEVSDLFQCPVTRQKLRRATENEIAVFDGDFPEGAWITQDLSRAYPIRDGFPILVPDKSVTLAPVKDPPKSE